MFDVALMIRSYMKFRIDKRRMLPHQVAFWELPNFVKLLVGGDGSLTGVRDDNGAAFGLTRSGVQG